MNAKENYYAALERQITGESAVKQRLQKPTGPVSEPQDLNPVDNLYADIGMKAFHAFHNCLDWLGKLGSHTRSLSASSVETSTADSAQFEAFMRDVLWIKERIERIDSTLTTIEAGLRRIDKFTLEAFRNVQTLEEKMHEVEQRPPTEGATPLHGRLSKEEATQLALDAARSMRARGRRLTLAAVAREAGLKYGQIVYAFGTRDGFMEALEQQLSEEATGAPAIDERLGAGA